MKGRLLLLSFSCACGGDRLEGVPVEPGPTPGMESEVESPVMEEAKARFANFVDIQEQVINRSCSPTFGVCHASNNYPDLSSTGTSLGAVMAPCNTENQDVTSGFDGCERQADVLVIDGVSRARIRYLDRIEEGVFRVVLDGSVRIPYGPAWIETAEGDIRLDARGSTDFPYPRLMASASIGGRTAVLSVEVAGDYEEYLAFARQDYDPLIVSEVQQGDRNRNGIMGADYRYPSALLWPGALERSYLYRRLTGTVAGSKMPLANEPLSEAELLAIACWVQSASTALQLSDPWRPIDYERCGG